MAWWLWLILAVLLVGAFLAGGLCYRIWEVRRAGTPVLFRALPAGSDRGWRHGSVDYTDQALVYYRLTSLRPGRTATLGRREIELVGRRSPDGTELEIMDPATVILHLKVTARQGPVREYEIAMEPVLVTALLSWLESRSARRTRRRAA